MVWTLVGYPNVSYLAASIDCIVLRSVWSLSSKPVLLSNDWVTESCGGVLLFCLDSVCAFQHCTTSVLKVVQKLLAAMLHSRHRNTEKLEILIQRNNNKARRGETMQMVAVL